MYRLIEGIDMERLTDFDFKVSESDNYIIATRDVMKEECGIRHFFRIIIFNRDCEEFHKRVIYKRNHRASKISNMRVSKKDISDLIEAGLVERRTILGRHYN